MSKQQDARNMVRTHWLRLLKGSLQEALAQSQAHASATAVVEAIWPTMDVEDLVRLDRADASWLCRVAGHVESLDTILASLMADGASSLFDASNNYGRGTKLRQLIVQELAFHESEVKQQVEAVFVDRDSDMLASPSAVQKLVLRLLATRCFEELTALAPDADESNPKRHLKCITALITPGGSRDQRDAMLRGLKDGTTKSFPFLLRYISPDSAPCLTLLEKDGAASLAGFTPSLLQLFPEAEPIRSLLQRFIERRSLLSELIPPDAPFDAALSRRFAELQSHIPRAKGGIFMPKELAVEQNRLDRFRVPDGVICTMAMVILIESLLRQLAMSAGYASAATARAGDLLRKIGQDKHLPTALLDSLAAMFDQSALSLRDALGHGAFFADDQDRVVRSVTAVSEVLSSLVNEMEASTLAPLTAPRWDAGVSLSAEVLATFEEQYQPAVNLVDQLINDEARQHVFTVLRSLTPDKRLVGEAAFVWWLQGQHESSSETPEERARGIGAILAHLAVLEELFRAVYEVHGERVLITAQQAPDVVKCELSIFDNTSGRLISPEALQLVFGEEATEQGFQRSIAAVRAFRDRLLHGALILLRAPLNRYAHLMAKLIFAVCSTVAVSEKPAPDTGPQS